MIPVIAAAGLLLAASPAPSPSITYSGSASIMGGGLTVPANEVRRGDVTVYGGSVDIEGQVTHDVRVYGGDVIVDGTVGHDVIAFGGTVHLGPRANVGHDVSVFGGTVDRNPSAQVGHDITQGAPPRGIGPPPARPLAALAPLPWWNLNPLTGVDFGFGAAVSIGIVLFALLLQLFFPGHVARARDALDDRPFASLGFGCLTAIAGTLLAVLLGILVILLPVSLAIAFVMGAGWLLGIAAVLLLIGQRLTAVLRVGTGPVPTLLIGGVLVGVLVNVPILGGLLALILGSMALGAVVLTRFGTRPHPPASPPPLTPPAGEGLG